MAPWADVMYGADYRFWKVYQTEIAATFRGEQWTVSEQARAEFGLYWMRHSSDRGFNPAPDTLNGGGNSGHQAIHLAATFGAARILLLGYDMQRTGGREHWHGPHEGQLRNGTGFPRWIESISYLCADLKASGVEVLNCSRETALRCVARMPITEALP